MSYLKMLSAQHPTHHVQGSVRLEGWVSMLMQPCRSC